MKIFLSFSSQELELAKVLNRILNNAFQGQINCFIANTDIGAGELWEERIKIALKGNDAILTILTPDFVSRPWAYLEWAAFWLNDKNTYVLVTEDVDIDNLIAPIKQRQIVRLNNEDSIKNLIKTLSERASYPFIPYGFASELRNEVTKKYKELSLQKLSHSFSKYRDAGEALPFQDNDKADIIRYFVEHEKDEASIVRIFDGIADNSVKISLILRFLDKGDLGLVTKTFEAVSNKTSLQPLLKKLYEGGEKSRPIFLKVLDYIKDNHVALRGIGEYLISISDPTKIDSSHVNTPTFVKIVEMFTNMAELRKLGEYMIENGFSTQAAFDNLVTKFYSHNVAELRKLLIALVHSTNYQPNEVEEQITLLIKKNQREAAKVMIELWTIDQAMFNRLLPLFNNPNVVGLLDDFVKEVSK